MKFSEAWLRAWVDPPLDTAAVAERLTMAGLEVEGIESAAPAFEGVVVGHVVAVEPHPDADRLRVCQVDDGSEEPLTVVCGAPNVTAGMRAPLARVGARLPGGVAIGRSRLRGVASEGMLCSAAELGLGEGGEGLLVLPAEAAAGADVRALLDLDDTVIELGLTPNRGDCLGILGIARELAVLTRTEPPVADPAAVPAAHGDRFPVQLDLPAGCPIYLGRIIRGIDPGAPTPLWMKERLRRSGLRSLGPVVDVTNYVLLEYGQPLHAFDLGTLRGRIEVRLARPGETIALLDGREVALEPDMMVIADEVRPVALAGIMGGSETAVTGATEDVFLECAWFSPGAVMGRARRLGLHTDASHRYERGVDPALAARAIERATALIVEIAGGAAGPVTEARDEAHLPKREPVRLRRARLRRLLGYPIADPEVLDTLGRLGLRLVGEDGEGWDFMPPSHRFDLGIEADLIEEVARIHGYDAIPAATPRGPLRVRLPGSDRDRGLRELLAGRGFREVITFSFISGPDQARFEPDQPALRLANPISADTAVMRTSLWPSLAAVAEYNARRQQPRVQIFELGTTFLPRTEGPVVERTVVAGLMLGDALPEQWGSEPRRSDFFDLKASVEAILGALGASGARFVPGEHPALHPGQTARIKNADGTPVGWIGRMHPALAGTFDFDDAPLLFELEPDAVEAAIRPAFAPLSRFPAVRRDLAVVVDADVTAADLERVARAAAGDGLKGLSLFDIYQGKGIDSGKKSAAIGLTFQDFSRTLTDAEIDRAIEHVMQALRGEFGATLRE